MLEDDDKRDPKTQVSWKLRAGPHNMTALDVIILWLTSDDNYAKWRRGTCSKKDIGKNVLAFLQRYDHPGRSSAMCQYQICLAMCFTSMLSPRSRCL